MAKILNKPSNYTCNIHVAIHVHVTTIILKHHNWLMYQISNYNY